MLEGFLLLAAVGVFNADSVVEFRKHSNGNPVYEFRFVEGCDTGLRDSGYTLSLTGNLVLKQVNKDGSVGDACVE